MLALLAVSEDGELTDQLRNFRTYRLTETAGRTFSRPRSLARFFGGFCTSSHSGRSLDFAESFGVQAEADGSHSDPERLATKLSHSRQDLPAG